MPTEISSLLKKHQKIFGPVLPLDLNAPFVCRLDFSAQNLRLANQPLENTAQFHALVSQMLQDQNASVGVGGYLENRVIYRRSNLFGSADTNRCLHLGVDIWAAAGTPVLAPLAGKVHSFQDNARFGDYGPTIILEHALEHNLFYTLYGHLSRQSLTTLRIGQPFKAGQQLAAIGSFPENGDWPPHLHFQVITDMFGKSGDFPGVCSLPEKANFAAICPDANLILQCLYLGAF